MLTRVPLSVCYVSFSTGNGHERDIKAFMDAGANRVLVKPIDINDVHSAMASVLVMGAVDE